MNYIYVWQLPSAGYWTGSDWSECRDDAKQFATPESAQSEDMREGRIITMKDVAGSLKVVNIGIVR